MREIIAGVCGLLSVLVSILSYLILLPEKQRNSMAASETEPAADGPAQKRRRMRLAVIDRKRWREISVKQWLGSALFAVLTGICCSRMLGYGLHWVNILKLLICMELLLAAAIVDFYTKKIPNKLVLGLLALRAIIFIPEYFCDGLDFMNVLIACLIGFFGCLVVFYLLSVLTKGGFGMGDVKLIAAMGAMIGISGTLYSILFGMLICMLAAVGLLILRKKGMKDQLPFGPFIYMGFLIAVSIGTF